MATEQDPRVADVEFVFSECGRLNSLAMSGPRNIPKADVWYSIPHVSGQGMMLCGRSANDRIQSLAELAGKQGGILNRVKLQTLRDEVAKLLTQRFLIEQREINRTQIDRVLAGAARQATKTCQDLTHWVPCHLMLSKDPDEIVIGPVTFRNRTSFRKLLAAKVRSYPLDRDPKGRKWDRRHLLEALRYYRAFQWVAEVKVENCDSEISQRLAERAVTSALDCLHVLLGAGWTDRMRIGGPAIVRDRRASLTIASDGELYVSTSYQGAGQVNFSDGWSARLSDDDFQHYLGLFGVVLEAAVNPDLKRPLSRRFLDAAQWFGEASRDESLSTATVKYATAIERMVMTQEKDDIAKTVSERVAIICCDLDVKESRNDWRMKTLQAYDIRSKLVHGAVSPLAQEARLGARLGAELAEATLLSTLSALGAGPLREERVSAKALARWFRDVSTWVDARMAETVAPQPSP